MTLSNYEEVSNGTATPLVIFSTGKFHVYSHDCRKVNKVTEEEIKRLKDENLPPRLTNDVAVVDKVSLVTLFEQ